ncbi:Sec63 Brl domain-containing protein [Amylocarpus encephaloides]|uniref:DNA 3'-5' helicase n=1 Tax=Amylocarpus encephaloides TaxID=45428 RepID=A0A9P7YTP9_9HELO|nr:Sec63 Brl domain-containing protein [Amylocarpus encephaloides]
MNTYQHFGDATNTSPQHRRDLDHPTYQPRTVQPQTSISGRLSLAPQSLQNPPEIKQRVLNHADNHFRFTPSLRAGFPVTGGQKSAPQTQSSDTIDQLANAMLLSRPLPQTNYNPEPQSFFQKQNQSRIPNPLHPQKQQITPPFNLIQSPDAKTAVTSSSPYCVHSSPTAQATMRRVTNRSTPPARQNVVRSRVETQVDHPRTPRQSTAPSWEVSPQGLSLAHAPPVAHGIQLVSPHELPDQFRSVFPYQLFNAVQSKCFAPIYRTDNNIVVSAPTGSGKTALLELAICKTIASNSSAQFKIVYQAPTKSLCAERMRDWSSKFAHLSLQCAELTGDTTQGEMARVRDASIIVTTPEKWDSITRKWADHHKLVQMVKLFLIDEVHIVKDVRGATLEAVVSRMKSMGANVRFVALSATIPNSEDLAVWLGRDHCNQQLPAHRETFDESFRPVRLQKYVYGFDDKMNDFAFEKVLDGKLPNLIRKHSQQKPIMIFCFTRKSCENTAKMLAEWWFRSQPAGRSWPAPRQRLLVGRKDLQELVSSSVAFHHAGLEPADRTAIEKAFLEGNLSVICCTSTLAVGVNLPCHLVILKGTVTFIDGICKEYPDLEVMQMLGRAGRPQFEDIAIAVIMTKLKRKEKYEKMVSGTDVLESSLHLNLIEHLNSEIGLRTVDSVDSAKAWLEGTFLAVRMRLNPAYYSIAGIQSGGDTDQRLRRVCERDVQLLQEHDLVTGEEMIKCTEYGEAMSRYMVSFETMKLLLSLPGNAKTEDILSIICQAAEFKELRMRPNQRACLREINKSPFMKYPIKDNISTTPHKISVLIQAQLGSIEHPSEKDFAVLRRQFMTDKNIIMERVQRLIRCIVDCKAVDRDAISTRHALDLARGFSAGYWENSNLQLLQIPNIGPAAVRKLISNNVNSIERLGVLDHATIERYVGKNPPFGKKISDMLLLFPRLTLIANLVAHPITKAGTYPKINVRVRLGFSNNSTPKWNGRKQSLTFMAETTGGVLIHFWRGGIHQLEKGHEIKFLAELLSPDDNIMCRVACDDIVGTQYSRVLKPDVPVSEFPPRPRPRDDLKKKKKVYSRKYSDEFGGDDIADEELLNAVVKAEKVKSEDVDGFVDIDDDNTVTKGPATPSTFVPSTQMANGKWTCNHVCRDRKLLKNGQHCKHRCCHEGLDKPRKLKARANSGSERQQATGKNTKLTASKLNSKSTTGNSKLTTASQLQNSKLKLMNNYCDASGDNEVEVVDLAEDYQASYSKLAPREYRKLHDLHTSVQEDRPLRLLTQKPQYEYSTGQLPGLPFSPNNENEEDLFDSLPDEDFPSPSVIFGNGKVTKLDRCPPKVFDKPQGELSPDLPLFSGFQNVDHSYQFNREVSDYKIRPPSSFSYDESMESLEAGMLELPDQNIPTATQFTSDLTSSFANGMFDFEAFPNEDGGQPTHTNSTPAEVTKHILPTSSSPRQSVKRDLSPTSELPELKCRRIKKGELDHIPSQLAKPLKSNIPTWANEIDAELFDELKDFVDFIE